MHMSSKYSKGSQWRKWDLHVHTPSSALQHSFGQDWDLFVERLIQASIKHGIEAIATADYFSIDGYKKLFTYYDPISRTLAVNGKNVQLFIIPGVELRLNIFNEQGTSINLHAFFDPDCSDDFITQNFLEELQVTYRGGLVPLKQHNLLAIGKSIIENSEVNLVEHIDGIDERHSRFTT